MDSCPSVGLFQGSGSASDGTGIKNGKCLQRQNDLNESEELDLNEEVSELKDQNLKQGEDIRVTVQKLNEAEDRNYDLEGKITKLQLQLDLALKQLNKVKKDHQTEIQEANEALDETKDKLRDSTTRIHRLEKSCQQFEAERDALQEEVTKASSEVQWFYHKNNELKASLKKSQDVFEKQLKDYVEGSIKLEEQNGQLLTEINALRSSKSELEKENSEMLEILENCQYRNSGSQPLSSHSHSNAHSSSFEEMADFECGDSFVASGDTPVPIHNLPQPVSQPTSIFHELQNAMFQNEEPPIPVKLSSTDASTQTGEDQEDENIIKEIPQETGDDFKIIISSSSNHHDEPLIAESLPLTVTLTLNPESLTDEVTQSKSGAQNHQSFLLTPQLKGNNHKPSWKMFPIDDRSARLSMGIIPDEDQERMRRYAYDVPLRSCVREAAILSRPEWRTLKRDLEAEDFETFKKCYGREEFLEEGTPFKSAKRAEDLDEIAEQYMERFPFLAEEIFNQLGSILSRDEEEDDKDIEELVQIKKRFEELGQAFTSDHDCLTSRLRSTQQEHKNSESRITEIIATTKSRLDIIRSHKMSGEIRELFNELSTLSSELDRNVERLNRVAKRKGRLDQVSRTHKFVNVMVLYLRQLNTASDKAHEELETAKALLLKNGITIPVLRDGRSFDNHLTQFDNRISLGNNNNKEALQVDSSSNENDVSEEDPFYSQESKALILDTVRFGQNSKEKEAENVEVPRDFLKKPQKLGAIRKFTSKWEERIAREFQWPWDRQETWSGIRRGFALILMLFGTLLIFNITFIPSCHHKYTSYQFPIL